LSCYGKSSKITGKQFGSERFLEILAGGHIKSKNPLTLLAIKLFRKIIITTNVAIYE
jgi:hypothetical protein